MPIMGRQIGQAMCDALGLPKNTASFTLRVRHDEIVSVECQYYPDNGPDLVAALAEYELARRPSAAATVHQAEAMGFDTWMHQRTEAAHDAYMARTRSMIWIDRIVFAGRIYESIRPRVLEIAGIL